MIRQVNFRAALVRAIAGWAVALAAGTTPAMAADRTVPIAAGPAVAGDLLLGFGPVWVDDAPSNVHAWEYSALGRANVPLGPRWNIEAEGNVKSVLISTTVGTLANATDVDGYLHLWTRHSGNSAWGVFGGVSPLIDVFSFFGGEVKHYLPRASFGAAAAF